MKANEFINNICEHIKYKPIRNEIAEEIKSHIEEKTEFNIREGMNEKEAEEKALNEMGNADEIGKKLNKIHKPKLDFKLLIIVCILLCFSFLVVLTRNNLVGVSKLNIILKYVFILIIGLLFGSIVYFMDYRKIYKYSKYLYIIATLVIILLSKTTLNGVSHFTAIVAMPLYIIAFVGFIQDIDKQSKITIKVNEKNINVNIIKLIILSVFSLILFEIIPSTTSAFIVAISYLVILTVKLLHMEKNHKLHIIILWSIPAVLMLFIIIFMFGGINFRVYRVERIVTSFFPEKDPNGSGWIGINQKQIIKSAKLIGECENKSESLYIFDEGTNYAFISILAHYGWIVSLSMVIAIVLLNVKLILNAIKIKDLYGKLLVIGISTIFILQFIFNLLMNLNLGIKADFNIPLISYGNASLIINIMNLSLILSIYRRKDIIFN